MTDVDRRREAQAPRQPRGQIAEDVPVHVGGDDDLEMLGEAKRAGVGYLGSYLE